MLEGKCERVCRSDGVAATERHVPGDQKPTACRGKRREWAPRVSPRAVRQVRSMDDAQARATLFTPQIL